MCIPCDKTFQMVPYFRPCDLNLEVWPTFENFNLGHNVQTKGEMPFILHMCIPFDMTFQMVP